MAKIQLSNPIVPLEINFINKYLPQANATHVMVYIYALGLCYSNEPSDNRAIATALDILESDVIKAWKYWMKMGIISLGEDGTVTFLSSVNAQQNTLQSPKAKIVPKVSDKSRRDIPMTEITKKVEEDKALSDTLKMAQLIWGKPLLQNETKLLYSILEWYSFPNEVFLMLLEYCALEERTKNMKYLEAVAEGWDRDGITTVKLAEKMIKRKEKERSVISKCASMFGLDRTFSEKEIGFITAWSNDMAMSDAMIKEAYERTILNTGKLSFQYMNKILQSWSNNNIRSMSALKESEGNRKPQKGSQQKPNNSNYDFDDIERLELERRLSQKEMS